MLEEGIYQIAAAAIGATISGIILLQIHHSKVKQELDLHRQKDIFDRKQRIYRTILSHVDQIIDYSQYYGVDLNWKISRLTYEELLLIGTEKVIKAFHEFHKEYSKRDANPQTLKKLYNAIREDLHEETLSEKEIRVMVPGKKTLKALEILDKHYNILRPLGLENLSKLSQINVEEIHSKTGIIKDDLEKIKDMAIKENRHDDEIKHLLDTQKS